MENNIFTGGKIDLSTFKAKTIQPTVRLNTDRTKELQQQLIETQARKEAKVDTFNQEVIELLRGIHANTTSMSNMIEFIQGSENRQEEILTIISEILLIGTAKSNNEATSMYRKVMDKINQTVEDAESFETLQNLANEAWMTTKLAIKWKLNQMGIDI